MTRPTRIARQAIHAIRSIAGGGPRPLAQSADVVITRGERSYLHSSAGARLLDAVAGYGVASLGHSDPRWVEAVVEQAGRLTTTSLYTIELGAYLDALAGVLPPSLRSIALSSTGTEAVEMAMRLAQTAQGRAGILTFGSGFHGKTAAVRYIGNPRSDEADMLAPPWLASAPYPACLAHDAVDHSECTESVADEIAAIVNRSDVGDIGVVLVEPILGTAGNIPPKRRFLAALRELCDDRGWLLIFDESITGFGRTGDLFALETFGAEPDVLILSKGLGGGFPLSAVCAPSSLWERSALSAPSATSSSYGGNPIACAAGLVTLEIITEPGFLGQVREVSAGAAQRLRRLAELSPAVARPRGVGLMLGFDLVDPATRALAAPEFCEAVFRDCRDRGLLIAANVPRVRVNPPLTVTAGELDFLFDVLEDVLT